MTRSRPAARTGFGVLLLVSLLTCLVTTGSTAHATEVPDPDLEQTLDQLPVLDGERVIESGHVDVGPKYADGQWRLLVHDDVADEEESAQSVWRHPEQTVFRILDGAVLSVPEDEAYDFLGAAAGSEVYVVPQTQNPDVVWLGWNTQDPEVMETVDRGVTLSLTGVQGPGTVTVYLQSGSFGEPQVLWSSGETRAQPLWVDVNTHTHANWVFTEPGVYLLRLEASADLVDGSSVSDTQYLRFAVGTQTSVEQALAADWTGADEPTAAATTGTDVATPSEQEDDLLVIGGLILLSAALAITLVTVLVRGNRTRRQALAPAEPSRSEQDPPGSAPGKGQP